jgi:ATP-dependent DNA ligase
MLSFPQEPMLAKPVDRLPAPGALPGGCVYEPKFDGYRALLFVDDVGCRVQSRRGRDISLSFPDIAETAAEQLPEGVVLDGELVIWGEGQLDFAELQRRLASSATALRRAYTHPASFVTFDILCVDGRDARSDTFRDRRKALEALFTEIGPPLQLAPQTADHEEAQQWMDEYAREPVGFEGVVAKGLEQGYRAGKRDWLKVRVRDTIEAIVGAVTGPLTAPDRLILGQYDLAGELVIIGGTGSLRPRQRRAVAELLELPKREHPWPNEISSGRLGALVRDRQPITRVEPALVVEVAADHSVDSGRRRHVAKFVRVRPDLTIEETEVV